MKIGLYIHIPFCLQKCFYCDFPSHANLDSLYEPYVAALCREISGIGGVLTDHIVDTIYIGGGTPTVLSTDCLRTLLLAVKKNIVIDSNAEISIEANPGTVDREKLFVLKAGGINRISFGVQSFSDSLLAGIGRIHTAAQAIEAVNMAKEAGISNINIDLMYGLPGQSIEQLQDSILQATELNVTHISAYGLKVEEGTAFASMEKQGRLLLPEEEIDEAMYEMTTQLLPEEGFLRYEISNFAKQGYECRHNLKYWQYEPYIGVGAAAHSFWQKERLANVSNVSTYIEVIETGKLPLDHKERPAGRSAMAEYIFLALRTVEGLVIQRFNQYFKVDFFKIYNDRVSALASKGLIKVTKEHIYLTPIGMKYGNIVFSSFLPEENV